MKRLVLVGAGFVGLAAARQFANAGWQVLAVTRSRETAATLGGEAFPVVACDVSASVERIAGDLANADAIAYCASSGRGGVEAYRAVFLSGLARVLEAARRAAVLFTSSTSLYAQVDGSVVTEASPVEPSRETARILLEAEDMISVRNGYSARLAGLYGPERSVYLRKMGEATAVIEGDGSRWINQVHRDDAAGAIFHLLNERPTPGVYNVADDSPMTQLDLYQGLAQRLKQPSPPNGPIDPDRKRGWTSKRVSNRKLRATGWEPIFPSFWSALETEGALGIGKTPPAK